MNDLNDLNIRSKNLDYKNFDKIYVLDTNIILNDAQNIELLSQNSSNLIVIPETAFFELGGKKSGFDEINFQAREFSRMIDNAQRIDVNKEEDMTSVRYTIGDGKNVTIDIVYLNKYDVDFSSIDPKDINDRKIVEVANRLFKENDNTVFISNDMYAKNFAIILGIPAESQKFDIKQEVTLKWKIELDNAEDEYNVFDIETMDVPHTVQGLEVLDSRGVSNFYYKTGNSFRRIDENEIKRQEISPRNMGQKTLVSMMLDCYHDVIVVDAPAGSGKTLIALSAAMRLLDTHRDLYDKIVYIRKTVISDTEELGYLPGSLEEKMSGYLAPLYSNLEYIVEKKYSQKNDKLTEEDKEDKMEEIIKKYGITSMYEGHLRGGNIRRAIILLDEFQNNSVSSAKTILTRVAEDCKIFVMGSNRQIDSKYLNKHNNALTYIKNRIGQDNMNVNLTGFYLDKTVRSNIAEWADTFN